MDKVYICDIFADAPRNIKHLSWENFFYYLVLGAFLSLITLISDSIIPALVLHIVLNFSYLS